MPDVESLAEPSSVSIRGNEGWLSPTSYWMPRHITTSAWLEHAPFAFWLVDALRPRSIVELGTHFGFSYFVFCEAVVRLAIDTSARALDTWEGDEHAGFYGEEVFDTVSRINAANYAPFSQLWRGYFDDSLHRVADGSVDLLHLDGRHGYEDVMHDFESWLPKLSNRGVAVFHDVAERHEGFGVWKYWDEMAQRYPSFRFDHGHGLGVLGVGNRLPDAMNNFFASAKAHAPQIRHSYEVLGEIVSGYAADVARRAEVDSLRNEVSRLAGEISTRDALVRGLQGTIEEFRASTSWKVTRPLRAIGSIARSR